MKLDIINFNLLLLLLPDGFYKEIRWKQTIDNRNGDTQKEKITLMSEKLHLAEIDVDSY